MKDHEFQELVDRRLSGLEWDSRKRLKVLCAVSEEEKPMKKIPTTFILIAAIVCLSVTALAAGLIFSPRYEASKVAAEAMKEQYGITDDLLSLFQREVQENEDGTSTITYSVPGADFPAERIGIYTVTVRGNKGEASWSNDGKDTDGGLLAEAYGPGQLHLLSYDYADSMQQLHDAGIITAPDTHPNPRLAGDETEWTEEDQAEWDRAVAEAEAEDQKRLEAIAELERRGKVTVDQAAQTAKEALVQEYSLTKEQAEKIRLEPDSTYAEPGTDRPLVNLLFRLWQRDDEQFTEKDGQYWVTVDLDTGVIEDIIYDSGLAGNG